MERGTCGFQVVMFICTALVDCKQNKGGNVIGSLHISEACSSLHRFFGQVFPQFFVQFSCGLFSLNFVAFYFSVVFEPVINYHVLLELAQSCTLALFTLPFQSLLTVTQLSFPRRSYFSFANFVCIEWLYRFYYMQPVWSWWKVEFFISFWAYSVQCRRNIWID